MGDLNKMPPAELLRLHAYCQELEAQAILDCMTHAQNAEEIEHVAGDVSKNGAESNLKQQPAPASRGQALRLLTQNEKDSLGRRAEGMDGNEWDQWVQEKFAQVNGLRVQGGSYEWD